MNSIIREIQKWSWRNREKIVIKKIVMLCEFVRVIYKTKNPVRGKS